MNEHNRNKHEKGQKRKKVDQGGEKGDKRRSGNPNKRRYNFFEELDTSELVIVTVVLTVLIADDLTGYGIIDDVLIIPISYCAIEWCKTV